MPPDDLDATVRLPRTRGGAAKGKPPASGGAPRKRVPWLAGGGVAVIVLGLGAGLLLWRGKPPVPPAPVQPTLAPPAPAVPGLLPPVPAPIAPAPAASLLPLRGEAEIMAGRSDTLAAMWFAANRRILVLDFPSLTAQGRAFNRMAAFIEKMGLPRDRVLNDGEMEDALKADKATLETYYYGHDYRAVDVQRFYQAVDRQKLPLWPEEIALRALLDREGLLRPDANLAVISIPREGSDAFTDSAGRFSLLRHELSHGAYFTEPDYAAFVRRFWQQEMDATDRAAFRAFLTRQDYDPANEDLIINEMQAHLMHTTDTRYFNARDVGLPAERIAALRAMFLDKMPRGWLHDAAASLRR